MSRMMSASRVEVDGDAARTAPGAGFLASEFPELDPVIGAPHQRAFGQERSVEELVLDIVFVEHERRPVGEVEAGQLAGFDLNDVELLVRGQLVEPLLHERQKVAPPLKRDG